MQDYELTIRQNSVKNRLRKIAIINFIDNMLEQI